MALSVEMGVIISEARNPSVLPFHDHAPSLAYHTKDLHPVLQFKPQISSKLISSELVIDEIEVVGGLAPNVYRRRVVKLHRQKSFENSRLGLILAKRLGQITVSSQ